MNRLFNFTNEDEPSTGATLKTAEADEDTQLPLLPYLFDIAVKSSHYFGVHTC